MQYESVLEVPVRAGCIPQGEIVRRFWIQSGLEEEHAPNDSEFRLGIKGRGLPIQDDLIFAVIGNAIPIQVYALA